MAFKFNPFTGQLDVDNTLSDDFVDVSGDTMTGELDMQTNAIILQSSGGTRYRLTVANDGALTTTAISAVAGESMGLLLSLTYA